MTHLLSTPEPSRTGAVKTGSRVIVVLLHDKGTGLHLFPLYQLSCSSFAMNCSTMFIFELWYNK